MSRGWIIGIVCLAINGTSVVGSWAQDGRPQAAESPSLADRLAAVKDKLRWGKSSEETSARHNARPTGAAARHHRPRTASANSRHNSTLPQIQPSDLLPDDLFGRTPSASSPRDKSRSYPSARIARAPRAGGRSTGATHGRHVRKSPPTTRENELESALADLLPTEEAQATDQPLFEPMEQVDAQRQPRRQETVRSEAARSNSFDLHEALISDEEESPAARPAETFSDSPQDADQIDIVIEAPAPEATESPRATAQPLPQPSRSDPFDSSARKAFTPKSVRPAPVGSSPSRAERRPRFAQPEPSEGDLSLSYQQPVIVSHVEGPRRIMVGREATYRITLENTSSTESKNLSASIEVPEWAEVVDAMSTSGVVERGDRGGDVNVIDWQLRELAARSSAILHLRLIPRSGQPLELGIQWTQAPMASQTMVEVQEPKLQIEIDGPKEVLFGRPQRYRLTLSNPGTGPAEQIVVQLIPPGGNPRSASTQPVGTLLPGKVKEIELELTAREAGELVMQANVTAEGGLAADAVKTIVCLKPELELDWRGPENKYAGTMATYYFRVRNPGTAKTEPVTVRVQLPKGARFETASEGHTHNSSTGVVTWQLPGLGVGEEKFVQVRCQVDQPGENHLAVTARTEDGGLESQKAISTHVVALADLKLDVTDPRGPIPLDEPVLYEIRVLNRGKTAAEGVSVVGLFSAGIDPTSVEGAQHTMRDGRVTFHPIASLPAGEEIVLRIRAKASQAGTHTFRAEVACQDLDIKLAAEETTRFYEDEYRWDDSETPYSAENGETGSRY